MPDDQETVEAITSVGPYELHLGLEKIDEATWRVISKGVEKTRPALLSMDTFGVIDKYRRGTVITNDELTDMEVR